MTDPELAVVIATLGRFEPLLDALDDLLRQEGVRFEIVVLDQNAQWPEPSRCRKERLQAQPGVLWLSGLEPGVVVARNLGVAKTRAPLVVFVDDDVRIPDRRFLAKHLRAHGDSSLASVCGREVHEAPPDRGEPEPGDAPQDPELTPVERLLAFDRSSRRAARVPVFSTCNGSVRRATFVAIGGFDEGFRGASYGDDADLVLRLEATGAGSAFDPRPWLIHLLAPAGGLRLSDRRNTFSEADRALSGWMFALRHGHGRVFWRLVYGWVLRRTLLLRRNVVRPWRWPRIVWALAIAYAEARRSVARGPHSIFTETA